MESRNKIIYMVHEETFKKEKQRLMKNKAIDNSKLISLTPYLDISIDMTRWKIKIFGGGCESKTSFDSTSKTSRIKFIMKV